MDQTAIANGGYAQRLQFRPIDGPIDIALATAYRRDSFVVSFGEAAGSFDDANYAAWLAARAAELPEGVVFALLDGEVVGQIEARILSDGTGYVHLYYLAAGYRGMRLGSQLHEYAVDVFQRRGISTFALAVSPTNLHALRFYDALGYRRIGMRANASPPVLEMRFALQDMPATGATLRERCLDLVETTRSFPYRWPGAPDAMAVLQEGSGTCASKHALLARRFASIGIESSPLLVIGPLVPAMLARQEGFREAAQLLEVHECLQVLTPWAGSLVVDITWDPPLLAHGLPGDTSWRGDTDMQLAIQPAIRTWAVSASALRAEKESARSRLYRERERSLRDLTLARLSALFATWRPELAAT